MLQTANNFFIDHSKFGTSSDHSSTMEKQLEDSTSDLTNNYDMVLAGGARSILRRKKDKAVSELTDDLGELLTNDIHSLLAEF